MMTEADRRREPDWSFMGWVRRACALLLLGAPLVLATVVIGGKVAQAFLGR